MKVLLKILSSPFGIALMIVHWLVVIFALWGDIPEPSFDQYHITLLAYYLAIMNAPSLIAAKLIYDYVIWVLAIRDFNWFIYAPITILCVTLQWQVIGFVIELLFKEREKLNPRLTKIVLEKN